MNMEFIGVMILGPNEPTLEMALESFKRCEVDAIHVLVGDNMDQTSMDLLDKYGCTVFHDKWTGEACRSRNILEKTIPEEARLVMFLDADDEVPSESAEIIKEIVASGETVVISCPYVYIYQDNYQIYRHRIYPRGSYWVGRGHEVTMFPDGVPIRKVPELKILHHFKGNPGGTREKEYILGLFKDLEEKPNDPRTLHYLGQTFWAMNQINNSIYYYERYLEADGWDEERLKALLVLASLYYNKKHNLETALRYVRQSQKELPLRREPLLLESAFLFAEKQFDASLALIDKAIAIPLRKDIQIEMPPWCYEWYPYFRKAETLKALGDHKGAFEALTQGLGIKPDDQFGLNVKAQYEQDCLTPPEIANKLVYIHLGSSPSPWTATSINAGGTGGRETSAVYLAKELQKYGYEVVLFSDFGENEGTHEGIEHIDFHKFYEVCGARPPGIIISASWSLIVDEPLPREAYKIMWCHDPSFGAEGSWNYLSPERISKWDAFVFGSPSQMANNQAWCGIPNEKCHLINLGICLDRFKNVVGHNRNKVVYTCSPDRGLERLLDWWGDIKRECPEAELHVFYGFENMKAYGISDEWVEKMKARMTDLSCCNGIKYHGRIGQNILANELLSAGVWVYPTHVAETMCLSALEASAALLPMVATKLGALETTIAEYGILIGEDINSKEYKDAFIGHVVRLLSDDGYWKECSQKAHDNAYERLNAQGDLMWKWESVGKVWDGFLSKRNTVMDSPKWYKFSHRKFDFEMALYDDDLISDFIKRDQTFYEHKLLDYISDEYGDSISGVVVDIGANIGNHAIYFNTFLKPKRIICFEPEPENFGMLQRNINHLSDHSRIDMLRTAIGAEAGCCSMRTFENNRGMARIISNEGDIQALPLDSFDLKDVELIKIDVEGYELEVLKGAEKTINNNRPIIIIEVTDETIAGVKEWCVPHKYGFGSELDMATYILEPLED